MKVKGGFSKEFLNRGQHIHLLLFLLSIDLNPVRGISSYGEVKGGLSKVFLSRGEHFHLFLLLLGVDLESGQKNQLG